MPCSEESVPARQCSPALRSRSARECFRDEWTPRNWDAWGVALDAGRPGAAARRLQRQSRRQHFGCRSLIWSRGRYCRHPPSARFSVRWCIPPNLTSFICHLPPFAVALLDSAKSTLAFLPILSHSFTTSTLLQPSDARPQPSASPPRRSIHLFILESTIRRRQTHDKRRFAPWTETSRKAHTSTSLRGTDTRISTARACPRLQLPHTCTYFDITSPPRAPRRTSTTSVDRSFV